MKKLKVAILSQDMRTRGGVASLNRFLFNYLKAQPQFDPKLIAYASFKHEPDLSVSIFNGLNKFKGIGKRERTIDGVDELLIGAKFPELEYRRYKSNALWHDVLNGFDIFHLVTGAAMLGLPFAQENKKFVAWIASTLRDEREPRLKEMSLQERIYYRAMMAVCVHQEAVVLERATHLFALSPYTREIMLREFPILSQKQMSILVSPVELNKYTPQRDKKEGYILFVGRFNDERKNTGLLLSAYRKAKEQLKKIPPLKLAGAVPKQSIVDMVAEMGLKNDVIFCGQVPANDLPYLYRNASLFVLPSHQEGLGIVLLEAMASGVPVISTRCGGPEIIIEHGENGLFCRNGDVDDMAEKIITLISDEALQNRFSEAGRETVEKKFSVEAIGQQILDVYRRVYPEYF